MPNAIKRLHEFRPPAIHLPGHAAHTRRRYWKDADMGEARREEQALRRVVALLAALAVLAERAAGRSLPVRFVVLALLRRAEAAVMAWVADATWMDLPCAHADPQAGCRPVDAAVLALRLRALAALLGALVEDRNGNRAEGHNATPRGGIRSCGLRVAACVAAPEPCDTS